VGIGAGVKSRSGAHGIGIGVFWAGRWVFSKPESGYGIDRREFFWVGCSDAVIVVVMAVLDGGRKLGERAVRPCGEYLVEIPP
jgi:hypothetical protein